MAAGWFIEWLIDAKLCYWFPYRTLWRTAHASKDWKEEIRPRAFWRDSRRCIWCATRANGWKGIYRRYIGRLGRACGWRDTSTFCNGCHACFGGHDWLEAIAAAEKGIRPIPFSTVFPGLGRWTTLRLLWRDWRRCRGCNRQDQAPPCTGELRSGTWNLWGRLQCRNIYLICEPCRRKLQAKRGHPGNVLGHS